MTKFLQRQHVSESIIPVGMATVLSDNSTLLVIQRTHEKFQPDSFMAVKPT